jgi:hypothetical protein
MKSEEKYAEEKFCVAVDAMATSSEGIRERLRGAYLSFSPIRAEQFEDEDLPRRFAEILDALTKVEPVGGEGSVWTTLRSATDQECERIAKMIVEFHEIVHDRLVWDYEFDKKFRSGKK